MHTAAFVAAGINVAQDLFVLVLPISPIWQLKVNDRMKWGIILMLSLGVFITVTSCIRMPYIINFGKTYNPTWDYEDFLTWSGVELSVTIIVASIPTIGAMIKQFLPRVEERMRFFARADEKDPDSGVREHTLVNSATSYSRQKKNEESGESQEELGFVSVVGQKSEAQGLCHREISGEALVGIYCVPHIPEPSEDYVGMDAITKITTLEYYDQAMRESVK